MKKGLIIFTALLLLVGIAASSHATLYHVESVVDIVFDSPYVIGDGEYVDHGWDAVNKLQGCTESECDSVTWRHLFTFPTSVTDIVSAYLAVRFSDDELDDPENQLTWETGIIDGEGSGDYTDLGDIDTGRYDYLAVDLTELFDGEYDVTLWTSLGDFRVVAAQLVIDYIPEPSTFLLLGAGLLGITLQRKRIKSKLISRSN